MQKLDIGLATKRIAKGVVQKTGYELRRLKPHAPGSASRPLVAVEEFLQDIKARGFFPRGMIDVGANAGDWARMALDTFPHTPLILIEPQIEMAEGLRRLCREEPTCSFVAAGASSSEGTKVQTIWPDLAGSSFLPTDDPSDQQTATIKAISAFSRRQVPMTTLDKVLVDHPGFEPDLIKLDIQGFEIEALAGGLTLFGRTEAFILEVALFSFLPRQPTVRDVVSFMAERDYDLYDVVGHLRRPHDGALGTIDLAFARANGFLRSSREWY